MTNRTASKFRRLMDFLTTPKVFATGFVAFFAGMLVLALAHAVGAYTLIGTIFAYGGGYTMMAGFATIMVSVFAGSVLLFKYDTV